MYLSLDHCSAIAIVLDPHITHLLVATIYDMRQVFHSGVFLIATYQGSYPQMQLEG